MAALIGVQLLHFQITAKLGEGGMGEVWRAEDPRLQREVAIKLLPEQLTADPDRLARFEREARVLASLNHPHIGAIYDVGEDQGRHFLVLELAEGETLEQRLEAGPLTIGDATKLARQIAEALEVAHEQGIVHRDLKPGNVMITADGRAKVLDFGLAKDWTQERRGSAPSLTASPTLTAHQTAAGVLLGTAAYMSPEQARGQAADKRADIWAFGCVLWEMLTGSRLFAQTTVSDTLAAVLRDEIDFSSLPSAAPAHLRLLLARCLERDPKERLRDIGEVRIALQGDVPSMIGSSSMAAAPVPTPSEKKPWSHLGWALAALLALLLAWHFLRPAELGRGELTVSALMPPEGQILEPEAGLAISPDGRQIVFTASDSEGVSRIWLRDLASFEARPLPHTEGALYPFWSPDGKHLGFFTQGELRRVPLAGGSSRSLAKVGDPRGGTWSELGEIVFSPEFRTPLYRIPAEGGEMTALTELDEARGEKSHRWPVFLEGGHRLLFLAQTAEGTSSIDESTIEVLSLDSGERETLLRENSSFLVADGQLVYWRDGGLYASAFDPTAGTLGDESRLVAEDVGYTVNEMAIAASSGSTLVFARGAGLNRRSLLESWNRDGTERKPLAPLATYRTPRLSHDGRRVTYHDGPAIWVRDLERGTSTRITFEDGDHTAPLFDSEDHDVYYTATRGGPGEIYRRSASGLGDEEKLLQSEHRLYARDLSPDDQTLLLEYIHPETLWDVYIADVETGKLESLVATPFAEMYPQYSPDGKWISYMSVESGREEIYVVPAEGLSGRWQVSTEGGSFPRWNPRGGEIAWVQPPGVIAVAEIREDDGEIGFGESQVLFELPPVFLEEWPFDYLPDGETFVVNEVESDSVSDRLLLVQNWKESSAES